MAAASTATVRANTAESAAAIVPAKVAVTIGPLAAKVQPAPAPDAKVRPAGRVSTTVVAAAVGALPRFWTATV